MQLFCTHLFKKEYEKLLKNKSYRSIEPEIINAFFEKEVSEVNNGTRLNFSEDVPYIKKRIGGRGGFRIYFLLIIKNECLYFMFVHPKSGSEGADNINEDSKAKIYKDILIDIQSGGLFQMKLSDCKKLINFQPPTISEIEPSIS